MCSPSKADAIGGLVYHPKPEWKESVSSYVIRLAEENGYKSIKVALQQIFHTKKRVRGKFYNPIQMDFMPQNGFENLSLFTGYSNEELRGATFTNLIELFLGQYDYTVAYQWLKPYLRKGFAYCPLCIQEYGYYSLIWRFLGNPGCPEHALKLVDKCYVCNAPLPLPLTQMKAKIGECPFCEAELWRASTTSLDYETYEYAQEFDNKLSLLLAWHQNLRWHPREENPRHRITSGPDILPIDWDEEFPEHRDFPGFKNYYEQRWGSKLNKPVKELFTLYWMGSFSNAAMDLYIKFRDDPDGLVYENRHDLLGKDYHSKMITRTNESLPSRFDVSPIQTSVQQLKEILIDIRNSAARWNLELWWKPELSTRDFEEFLGNFSRWESQLMKLRDARQFSED